MRRLSSTTPVAKKEIEQHHPGGEKEVDSGDHRVVSVLECIKQEPTYPRQVEDVLHDHGAPDQDRQLQAAERLGGRSAANKPS